LARLGHQSRSIGQHKKLPTGTNEGRTSIMCRQFFLRRAAIVGAVATAGLFSQLPAQAQIPGPMAAAPTGATSPRTPACVVAPGQARFDFPLPHTARRLASGEPIKIVALGSSSTSGAGASTSAFAYPNRLAEELTRRFPGHQITVLNRGVNGEEITD